MRTDLPVPETRVLAIASHVTYGYVGNKMATFVMQALGCDVSAIDTVHFSNHTAYKQFKGRKVPVEEIQTLYEGLRQSNLNDFDMLLSGYAASKEVVELVGRIARDIQEQAKSKPGSFFWILDPVMGDEGRLYVAEDIVPAYKSLLPQTDLILPNAFEAELLSDMQITDMKSLVTAVTILHKKYRVPHVIVTSLRISPTSGRRRSNTETDTLVVVGSSCKKGDMFAALLLVRLREAITSSAPELMNVRSWMSADNVAATDLPLARATEKTLASMHTVLAKTVAARAEDLKEETIDDGVSEEEERQMHLRRTKASEVRVTRYYQDLRYPDTDGDVKFVAQPVEVD